jgi:hypothetical protein
MKRLVPSVADIDLSRFETPESEGQSPAEMKEAGSMALRAMQSAMQDGNYEAAFKAFCTAFCMADELEDMSEPE